MILIVGLGNPGREYAESRHNLGFRCINHFARAHGIEFSRRKSKARLGEGDVSGQEVVLVKPQTFMNLSGEAVGPLVRYYRVALPDVIVVHDDVDLPLGRIRLREKGSAAGHNGLKSIIQNLGCQEFARLRVGIGPGDSEGAGAPAQGMRRPDYVLGHFMPEEKPVVEAVCARAADAIECFVSEGIVAAMNKFNAG